MTILTPNQLLEVVDEQTFLSQVVTNRYFYWTSQDPSSETDFTVFAQNCRTTVVTTVLERQSDVLEHTRIIVRPRTGLVLETIFDLSGAFGIRTGQRRSTFEASKFTLNRTNASTRVGFKRFAGLTEDMVAGNTIEASQQANLDAVSTALLQPIVQGAFSWQPVIARSINPATDDWVVNIVASVSNTLLITSQVSRKQT